MSQTISNRRNKPVQGRGDTPPSPKEGRTDPSSKITEPPFKADPQHRVKSARAPNGSPRAHGKFNQDVLSKRHSILDKN